MKTAAWAAPTAVVFSAAPAFAASPESQKGLQGWVTVGRSGCYSNEQTITIDGRGEYPNRGLWIMETAPGLSLKDAKVERASITFYFPTTLGPLNWTNNSDKGWSNLVRNADGVPQINGYDSYTSTYSGSWTFNGDVLVADRQPRFTVRTSCTRFTSYAYRSVTVDGDFVAFRRGPISL